MSMTVDGDRSSIVQQQGAQHEPPSEAQAQANKIESYLQMFRDSFKAWQGGRSFSVYNEPLPVINGLEKRIKNIEPNCEIKTEASPYNPASQSLHVVRLVSSKQLQQAPTQVSVSLGDLGFDEISFLQESRGLEPTSRPHDIMF